MCSNAALVRYASMCDTVSMSTPSSAGIMPSGAKGSTCLRPSRKTTSIRSTVPYWNRVTNRVHSPMSVGATLLPMRALTSVDLPDLIRPATATCKGAPRRRNTWANPAAVRGDTCGCNRRQRSATDADSGPASLPPCCAVVLTAAPCTTTDIFPRTGRIGGGTRHSPRTAAPDIVSAAHVDVSASCDVNTATQAADTTTQPADTTTQAADTAGRGVGAVLRVCSGRPRRSRQNGYGMLTWTRTSGRTE